MFVLVAATFFTAGEGQASEISGSVVAHGGQPVSNAEVQVRQRGEPRLVQFATTGQDGKYVLRGLPPGTYDLRITALGFYSTELHDVQVGNAPFSLPSVLVEVGIFDCNTDRPAYYRVGPRPPNHAAVGGMVMSDKNTPLPGATVTLFVKGRGRIASEKTTATGSFRFANLTEPAEQYWIAIESQGVFLEEVGRLTLWPGLETVYSPITLESCSPGHCQPHLKSIRVIPPCA
jgi:hypothetical protein